MVFVQENNTLSKLVPSSYSTDKEVLIPLVASNSVGTLTPADSDPFNV